jgi:uncharacterized membrane protein YqhA
MLGRVLAASRFLLVIAIIGCLLVAAGTLVFGAVLVVKTVAGIFTETEITMAAGKSLAIAAIEVIDLFLIATVAYITAAGLYTLFINPKVPAALRMGIGSLDDLKEKLIGVIVVALSVLFLGDAVNWGEGPDLLYFGGAVGVVILALGYFIRH